MKEEWIDEFIKKLKNRVGLVERSDGTILLWRTMGCYHGGQKFNHIHYYIINIKNIENMIKEGITVSDFLAWLDHFWHDSMSERIDTVVQAFLKYKCTGALQNL